MTTGYKASIYFEAYETSYTDGESTNASNWWHTELTANTLAELKDLVLEATYSNWENLDDEQMNDYDFAIEYHANYMANEGNEGEASLGEIAKWRRGELRLWAINCHVLVSEINEMPARLPQ